MSFKPELTNELIEIVVEGNRHCFTYPITSVNQAFIQIVIQNPKHLTTYQHIRTVDNFV